MTLVLVALVAGAYFGATQAISRVDSTFAPTQATVQYRPFFIGYATALLVSIAVLPLAVRRLVCGHRDLLAASLVAALALATIHFRHGMYLHTKFDPYVMNPQQRVQLDAPSPALEFIAHHCQGPARISGLGGVLTPGFNAVSGLEHFSAVDPVLNAQHRELLDAVGVPAMWGWRHLVSKEEFASLRPILDLMNVRWWLGSRNDAQLAVPGLTLAARGDLDVFESPTAWPRAFFTDRISSYGSVQEFAALVTNSDHRPLAAVQRSGPDTPAGNRHLSPDQAGRTVVPAANYHVTSNSIAFDLDAPTPGVAVLSESWLDGDLRASVDGRPVPCFRANHAFRGLWIGEAGHHRVRFEYWPRVLTASLYLAAAGVAGLVAALAAMIFLRSASEMARSA